MVSTMHAVVIEAPGGPEALEVRQLPHPTPRPGDVPESLQTAHGSLTAGAGAELVGVNVLGDTLRATRSGGVVCFTGMVPDQWSTAEFTPMDWIPNRVRLTAYSGEARDLPPEVLQEYLDALADGTTSPPPLITCRGLEEARFAHEDMDHSRPGEKIVQVLHENGAES